MSDVRDVAMTRTLPLPLPGLDNLEFYEATRRGELRFQRCAECGVWRHYPRPACGECYSREFSWELSSGRVEKTFSNLLSDFRSNQGSLGFHRSGEVFFISNKGVTKFVNISTGKELVNQLTFQCNGLSFHPNGRVFLGHG